MGTQFLWGWACVVVLQGFASATQPAGAPEARRGGGPAAEERTEEAQPKVAKLESARVQLDLADELRRGLRGLDEARRPEARRRAAEAYRAVRGYFPEATAMCAEAAYRCADLLRQDGDLDGARAEYGAARQLGASTPWRVRGAMELGHLERRVGRASPALAAYEAVIADETAAPSQRDEASLWSARVLADSGRSEDAVRVWTRVAEHGDDPLDRIRAYDGWAQQLVTRDDLEGAAGVLERCRARLADVAQEESRLGERVRNALTKMRAIEVLARAVELRERGSPKREGAGGGRAHDAADAARRTDGARSARRTGTKYSSDNTGDV